MDSSSLSITPTSSSSIRQQPSINSERKREGFKQQFKRFVGWGSSYNVKKQPNGLPPPITTPYQNQLGLNSPSESFVSAPSASFPPTPGTLNSAIMKNPVVEHLDTPLSHKAPSLSVSSRIVSNHSTLSSVSSTSSVTSEELTAAAAAVSTTTIPAVAASTTNTIQITVEEEEDEEEEEQEDKGVEKVMEVQETKVEPIQAEHVEEENVPQQQQEEGDIQTQYAMWMTTNAAVPEETPISKEDTVLASVPLVSTPSKGSLHKKSSIVSSVTDMTPSISSVMTEVVDEETKEHNMHPMSSGQEVDDLFLLVAHGVEFLTSRENSKWEEYGGYEFHPWNRPQGSFSVRHRDLQRNKEVPLPQQLTSNESRPKIETVVVEEITVEEELSESPAPPPPMAPIVEESPSALAKRILGAKPEAEAPVNQAPLQQHPSVDDEELQRIVAAHIVF